MAEKPRENSISMSNSAADALIASGDGDASLLYIHILRNGGVFDAESAAASLALPRERVDGAFLKLLKLGLAGKSSVLAREDTPPDYTVDEIKERLGESSEFSGLVQETQRRLGRMLSGADLIILFGMFDYLGLSAEVILILITYCIEENRRRYGEGRMPTMRHIEKEAYIWVRRDIMTPEKAEEYLRRRIDLRKKSEELKKLLGIKNRELSPTEEKYIAAWIDMGFDNEPIELAYDRTVVKTGELSWAYMNSIIRSWHSKGLHTIEQINEGDGKREPNKKENVSTSTSTQEEIERMQRYLNKLKLS